MLNFLVLWDVGNVLCFSCKKIPNSVTLRPQHSDLEESGWELSSPLNSFARSFGNWDALFLSGEAGR